MEIDSYQANLIDITLEEDDLKELSDFNPVSRKVERGEEVVRVQVDLEGSLCRFPPIGDVETNADNVYDDALDALMMLVMAYQDLERKVEDNEAYPEAHSRDYSGIIREVREDYPVKEAIDTFEYYSEIHREMYS